MNKNTPISRDQERSDAAGKMKQDTFSPDRAQQPQGAPSPDSPTQEKKRKRRWVFLALLLLLLLLFSTCVAFEQCGKNSQQDLAPVAVMPDLDANAREIGTRDELEGAMQQEADANYFTLQINPEASFSSASGEGVFEIVNPSTNVYPISVDLYIDGFDEPIFRSGGILPNRQITAITAAYHLEPGTYTGTAKVVIYSEADHVKKGETEARIQVTVA